jgi:hypothetical protein
MVIEMVPLSALFYESSFYNKVKASGCQCQSRNTPGFDSRSSDTVESKGRQMKKCWITYLKEKISKKSPLIFIYKVESWPCDLEAPNISTEVIYTAAAVLGKNIWALIWALSDTVIQKRYAVFKCKLTSYNDMFYTVKLLCFLP